MEALPLHILAYTHTCMTILISEFSINGINTTCIVAAKNNGMLALG